MPSGVFLQFYPTDVDIYGGIQEALIAAAYRLRNSVGIFTLSERDLERLTRLQRNTIRAAVQKMRQAKHLILHGGKAGQVDGYRLAEPPVQSSAPPIPAGANLSQVGGSVLNQKVEPSGSDLSHYKKKSAKKSAEKHSAAPECAVLDLPSGPAPPPTRQSHTAEGKTDESRYLSDQERADVAHYPPEQRSAIASQLQHIQTTSGFVVVTADLVDKFLSAAGPRCKPYEVADWLAGKASSQRKGGCLIPDGPGYFIRAVQQHFGGGVPRKPPASQFQALEIAQKASVNGPGVLPTRPPGSGAAKAPRATDGAPERVPEGWTAGISELLGKVKSFPGNSTGR